MQALYRNREDWRKAKKRVGKRRNSVRRALDAASPYDRQYRAEMDAAYVTERVGEACYAVGADGELHELLAQATHPGSSRLIPWATHKGQSKALAAGYYRVAEQCAEVGDLLGERKWRKRADNVSFCASSLVFAERSSGKRTLVFGRFCHDPLCPTCMRRKSEVWTRELSGAVERIAAQDFRLLHVVLTVPNVPLDELRETFDRMSAALVKMSNQSWWRKRFCGYYRKFEWTLSNNPTMVEAGRIAHPHVHLLLAVKPEYFHERPDAWVRNLQKAFLSISYSPIRSAARCRSYQAAVCNVRAAIARSVEADMREELAELTDGDSVGQFRVWGKYRHRYQRMAAAIDVIAEEHRPDADSSVDVEKEAVRTFARAVADAADPLYIDEPNSHIIRDAWRKAFGDDSITQIAIHVVTTKDGQTTCGDSVEAEMQAVKEIAKYVSKSMDYILPHDPDETDRRVSILRDQLSGLHMVSASGVFADALSEARAELEKTEEKDGCENRSVADPYVSVAVVPFNQKMHAFEVVQRASLRIDDLMKLERAYRVILPDWIYALCPDSGYCENAS